LALSGQTLKVPRDDAAPGGKVFLRLKYHRGVIFPTAMNGVADFFQQLPRKPLGELPIGPAPIQA
jgi:hypothetical protein